MLKCCSKYWLISMANLEVMHVRLNISIEYGRIYSHITYFMLYLLLYNRNSSSKTEWDISMRGCPLWQFSSILLCKIFCFLPIPSRFVDSSIICLSAMLIRSPSYLTDVFIIGLPHCDSLLMQLPRIASDFCFLINGSEMAWTHFNSPPQEKMAAISQMLFWDAFFLWMESFSFWFKFHWSLFLRVQHWCRWWIGDK